MPIQKLIRPVGLVVTFFILLGIYTKLVGPIEFRVNQISTQKAAFFDVSGEGSATAIPDQAETSLGITVSQSTVAAAQTQAPVTPYPEPPILYPTKRCDIFHELAYKSHCLFAF